MLFCDLINRTTDWERQQSWFVRKAQKMAKIEIDSQLEVALSLYRKEITVETKRAAQASARRGASMLRRRSPRKTGAYAKGWTSKKAFENSFEVRFVIYNPKHYRLTHLLERGTKDRKGGTGRMPAFPHIEPVEKEVVREYERMVEEAIRG